MFLKKLRGSGNFWDFRTRTPPFKLNFKIKTKRVKRRDRVKKSRREKVVRNFFCFLIDGIN